VSFENISDVDVSVESSTPMPDDNTVSEDEPSELIVLYLPVACDETTRKIAICNDDYKIVAFSHSILHEFIVVNEVMGIIHSKIVRTIHSQRTDFYKILRRIVSITGKLDLLWDPTISLTLSGEDSTRSAAYVFLHLLSPKQICHRSLFPHCLG